MSDDDKAFAMIFVLLLIVGGLLIALFSIFASAVWINCGDPDHDVHVGISKTYGEVCVYPAPTPSLLP